MEFGMPDSSKAGDVGPSYQSYMLIIPKWTFSVENVDGMGILTIPYMAI